MKTGIHSIGIVVGGELERELISSIQHHDFIIGVDNGAWWLLQNNVTPDVAIGDFDSVTQKQLQVIKKNISVVKQFPAHKNATDSELAVRYALKLKPKEIVMYGAVGSRIDHTLATLGLLETIGRTPTAGFVRGGNYEMHLLPVGLHRVEKKFTYVSLIPVTVTAWVVLNGFAYDGEFVLHRGKTLGISNELSVLRGDIEVKKGKVFVFQTD